MIKRSREGPVDKVPGETEGKVTAMTKADIALRIHQDTRISKEEAVRMLEWILGLLKTTLQRGESILIAGFGKFTVRQKHARPGRNIRTGEALTISARRVVSFYPSRQLKEEIYSPSAEEQEPVT